MTIDQLIDTTFHTAEADQRLAEADYAFVTEFLSLKGEAQAARWRGLTHAEKFRLCVRRIEQLAMSWMPSVIEAQIAKYDERFALPPIDAAIEGALERLAFDNARRAETADKKDRAFFRRQATAYSNALDQYQRGVRPVVLDSGARIVPSSTPGNPAHIIRLEGDWTCSCKARQSMHWPIALVVGIEQAMDDMERFDDGDVAAEDVIAADPQARAQRLLDQAEALLEALRVQKAGQYGFTPRVQRLARIYAAADRRYARRVAAMRACDPPGENPLGDDEGDELPARAPWWTRATEARSHYLVAA
jgi:hypothetical protein